ncbi:MAG TPA: hypothetical protein PLW34_01525 [Termitinemataceae bacterium]|nr:hypothetical protein [Termitinemataceae bacterium]HOM22364.1 hypothetical protein [Termitinemataceae bacterium]HPP99636.1 hypothetical protein [Termitinemataceae bacterium]
MNEITLTFEEILALFRRLKREEDHLDEVESYLLAKIENVLYTRYSIAEMEALVSEATTKDNHTK